MCFGGVTRSGRLLLCGAASYSSYHIAGEECMGMNQEKKIWIIGHRNPDTDSICAAIAYADLKNKTSEIKHEAKRAGAVNEETKYVLKYFGVRVPKLVTDVGAQIKDISFRKTAGVNDHISMKRAWERMKTENVVTLPVTDNIQNLRGIIVTSDIATSYMDVYDIRILATAKTPYKNIIETLEGTILAGNEHAYFTKGKVVVASSSSDWLEEYIENDDLVILGDRTEAQLRAVESNASCLVICSGFAADQEVIEAANRRDCIIITTPYDTFTAARLMNQSMPIKYFMTKGNLIKFNVEDYIDDVKEVMSKIRHRDFPVVDEAGNYIGMISRRNLLSTQKKRVILVDHNEKTQAVEGIDGAEILEIIDHHRLGSLETISPVYFRNQPLGCTSTIIYQMYQEKAVKIPVKIAGLLCSAIISDTLMFRSPTCTALDKSAAQELALIASIDIDTLAKNMFQAGSDFNLKSPEQIFYQDFKTFQMGEHNFGVAQISAMGQDELEPVKKKLHPYMESVLAERKLDMVFIMLTDILEESTLLIAAGKEVNKLIEEAFVIKRENEGYLLKGVVSRKKQLIPALMAALQD